MASIREHVRKNGTTSYYVLWREPDSGKQTSMTVSTRQQAKNLKKLLDANGQRLEKVEHALAAVDTFTVGTMIDQYIKLNTRATPGTLYGYRTIKKQHFDPELSTVAADEIDDETLVTWIRWMQSRGLSSKTIANAYGLLSSAFHLMVERGDLPRNPCKRVKLPRTGTVKRAATFLTKAEWRTLEAAIPDEYRLFAQFLVNTGARFGEVTALTWSDLDLDADIPTAHVSKAWKEGGDGRLVIGAPKSKTSIRYVSLPSKLAKDLKKSAEDKTPTDLVFPDPRGAVMTTAWFHKHAWKPALTEASKKGFAKHPRVHDLRHTHASWLLASNKMSVFDVSRRLGHSDTSVTTRIYGHLMESAQSNAVRVLDELLV